MRTSQRSLATGSVELEQADELERLRRRAYGPDADIAEDATAQARLSELEAAHRRQSTLVDADSASGPSPMPERAALSQTVEASRGAPTSVPAVVDTALAGRDTARGSVTEQDRAGGPIVDSDPIAGARAAPWWRRRRFVILGAGVAALALNVAIIAWTSQLLADASLPAEKSTANMPRLYAGQAFGHYVPSPDYVLAVRSVGVQADAPNDQHGTLALLGLSPDELRRYEGFQGFNVWSGESRYGLTCLLVAVPVQGLREGLSGEGCSLEGLDPSADLPPARGGGGLIRFVLRDDHVNVYVYEHGADPNASRG